MPNWGELLNQLNSKKNPVDEMRHKYLGILSDYTGRIIMLNDHPKLVHRSTKRITKEIQSKCIEEWNKLNPDIPYKEGD